jgi:hypothetical protein
VFFFIVVNGLLLPHLQKPLTLWLSDIAVQLILTIKVVLCLDGKLYSDGLLFHLETVLILKRIPYIGPSLRAGIVNGIRNEAKS